MSDHRYYLTVEDVRDYIMDRTLEDNELELDLVFTDEEIRKAMTRAAREYNSLPPLGVSSVTPEFLPNDTNMFLDGTVAQLYMARRAKLARNDVDYQAGNITTNIVQKQIAHLTQMTLQHRELFREAATTHKLAININNAWGFF
jgi:hypothetical protein